MSLPTEDLTSGFWITVGTMFCGIIGLAIKYGYKSKCKEVSCCCIRVVRDVSEEAKEDLEAMKHIPTTRTNEGGSIDEPPTPMSRP